MKEKEMKKSWLLPGMLCILAVLMMFVSTRTVHAEKMIKSGDYTYTVVNKYSSSKWKARIYSQKTGGAKKKLITVTGIVDLQYVYNGNLYYEKDNTRDETVVDLWALNLKTGKTKMVVSNATVQAHYGAYAVLMPNTGAAVPLHCTVYNMKTGKSRVISKDCLGANISGKKIYYAETTGKPVGFAYKTRIYSCSLSGSSKKAVSGYFKASYCNEITSKYVRYYRSGKTYKYTY